MDTEKVIGDLKTLSVDLRSQSAGLLAKADVIDLAVSQLEGTLETQALALKAEYEGKLADKDATIAELQVEE